MSSYEFIPIILEPLTPLLFRTPKPFEIGGEAYTEEWPNPSTISGMLRNAILESILIDNKKTTILFDREKFREFLVGRIEEFKFIAKISGVKRDKEGDYFSTYDFAWRLVGPYFFDLKHNEVYYPIPMDYLPILDDLTLKIEVPDLREALDVKDLFELDYFGVPIVGIEKEYEAIFSNYVIKSQALRSYIKCEETTRHNCIKIVPEIIEKKITPHIELRRDTKTLRITRGKGHYFIVESVNFRKDWCIVIGVIAPQDIAKYFKIINGKIVRFGGEFGLVKIHIREDIKNKFIENDYVNRLSEPICENCDKNLLLRITFTNPGVFYENGEYVPYLSKINTPSGHKLKLIGFSMRRVIISGWDYLKNKPKDTIYGCDKSSVYYFELENKDALESLTYRFIIDREIIAEEYRGAFGSFIVSLIPAP